MKLEIPYQVAKNGDEALDNKKAEPELTPYQKMLAKFDRDSMLE